MQHSDAIPPSDGGPGVSLSLFLCFYCFVSSWVSASFSEASFYRIFTLILSSAAILHHSWSSALSLSFAVDISPMVIGEVTNSHSHFY